MSHFTKQDLERIRDLATEKSQATGARDDFELYVLLRAIPKLIDDINEAVALAMIGEEPIVIGAGNPSFRIV